MMARPRSPGPPVRPPPSPTLALALAVGGCAEPVAITHTLALRGTWSRVEVGDNGGDLHLQSPDGDITRRRSFDGTLLERFDPLPTAGEWLHDVTEEAGTARVLASGAAEFFDWTGTTVAEPLLADGRATGILGARSTERGVAVLRDDADEGCLVDWLFSDDLDTVPLPAEACATPACVVADRPVNRLLISTGGATWSVSPTEATTWESPGALCAFDASSGTLAVGETGSRLVRAFGSDGEERWAVELPNPVRGLGDLGAGSAIAATSVTPDGAGELLLLDAGTGDPTLALETPRPGTAVVGGGQGRVLALLLATELHVFSVDLPEAPSTTADSGGR